MPILQISMFLFSQIRVKLKRQNSINNGMFFKGQNKILLELSTYKRSDILASLLIEKRNYILIALKILIKRILIEEFTFVR